LVHLIGFHDRIDQGFPRASLFRKRLNLMATFQQMLTVEAQFLRQMPSGNPLDDALQDPYDQKQP